MDKTITINADTVRMIALNREMNPRITVYGEATNTTNPVTGKAYEDHFVIKGEFDKLTDRPIYLENSGEKLHFTKISYFGDLPKLASKSPSITQTIQLQKALGRMDVREGRVARKDYLDFVQEVEWLSSKYRETPDLTLDSITSVTGLEAALFARKSGRESINFILSKDERAFLGKGDHWKDTDVYIVFPRDKRSSLS